MDREVEINFFPVGQGLFSAGLIRQNKKIFSWIYDCGTINSQKPIDDGINYIKNSTSTINLLILSHFHKDHINGITKILKNFKVKILLLPFVPLHYRILMAFNQKIFFDSKLINFFLNPIEYISSIPEISVEKIVFVPASSENVEIPNRDLPITPDDFPDDLDNINFEEQNITDEERIDLQIINPIISIAFMKNRGILNVSKIFEFIPYNDIIVQKIRKNFIKLAIKLKNKIYIGTPKEKINAFNLLKKIYIKEFGKKEIQNQISLFVYAGPITNSIANLVLINNNNCNNYLFLLNEKNYILYTGDGYLNNNLKVKRLINYFDIARIKKLNFMQIMHHGSKNNWYSGLAAILRPQISVFSSDPNHKTYRHPHLEVLHDFSPYLPILVNQQNSLRIKYEF